MVYTVQVRDLEEKWHTTEENVVIRLSIFVTSMFFYHAGGGPTSQKRLCAFQDIQNGFEDMFWRCSGCVQIKDLQEKLLATKDIGEVMHAITLSCSPSLQVEDLEEKLSATEAMGANASAWKEELVRAQQSEQKVSEELKKACSALESLRAEWETGKLLIDDLQTKVRATSCVKADVLVLVSKGFRIGGL